MAYIRVFRVGRLALIFLVFPGAGAGIHTPEQHGTAHTSKMFIQTMPKHLNNNPTNHMPTKQFHPPKINAREGPALEKDAPSKRVKTSSSTYSQSTTSRASGHPDVRPSDVEFNPSLESAPPSPPVAMAFGSTAPACIGGGRSGVSPTSAAAPIGRTGILGSRSAISAISIPDISAAGSTEDFFLLGVEKARADKKEKDVLALKVQELQNLLEQKTSEHDQKNDLLDKTTETLREKDEQLEKKGHIIDTIHAEFKESIESYNEMKRLRDILEEENGDLKKQIFEANEAKVSHDKTKRENKKLKQEVKGLKRDIDLKESRIEELEKCLDSIMRANRKNNREAQTVLGRRYLLEDTDDEE